MQSMKGSGGGEDGDDSDDGVDNSDENGNNDDINTDNNDDNLKMIGSYSRLLKVKTWPGNPMLDPATYR